MYSFFVQYTCCCLHMEENSNDDSRNKGIKVQHRFYFIFYFFEWLCPTQVLKDDSQRQEKTEPNSPFLVLTVGGRGSSTELRAL